MWNWFRRLPEPSPRHAPDPVPYGTVRIVPKDIDGFAVERYEVSDADMKRRYGGARWYEKFEGTEAECEKEARSILQRIEDEKARCEAEYAARRAHREAHPPRVITL